MGTEWAVRVPLSRDLGGNPFLWRLGRRKPPGPKGESWNPKASSETSKEKVHGFWIYFLVRLCCQPCSPESLPHIHLREGCWWKIWHTLLLPYGTGLVSSAEVFPVLARMSLVDSLVFQVLVQDQGCLLPWAQSRANAVTPAQSWATFPCLGIEGLMCLVLVQVCQKSGYPCI